MSKGKKVVGFSLLMIMFMVIGLAGSQSVLARPPGPNHGPQYYCQDDQWNHPEYDNNWNKQNNKYKNKEFKNTKKFDPKPAPLVQPTLQIKNCTQEQINLHWNEVNKVQNYVIYRSDDKDGNYSRIAALDGCHNSYTDRDCQPDTKYYYKIECRDDDGQRCYSNQVCGHYIGLRAPSDLKAKVIRNNDVRLTWQDNSGAESGFRIERRKANGSFREIAKVKKNIESYIDDDLASDTRYYYRIRAYDSYRSSNWSDEIGVKISRSFERDRPSRTVARYYLGTQSYYVNDQAEVMDCYPIVSYGRTMLPIRYIASPLGALVTWDNSARKTIIVSNGKTIEIWSGRNRARVNGEYRMIDPSDSRVTAITVSPGRIMLPVRFIAENLDCDVDWSPWNREVRVTCPGGRDIDW